MKVTCFSSTWQTTHSAFSITENPVQNQICNKVTTSAVIEIIDAQIF